MRKSKYHSEIRENNWKYSFGNCEKVSFVEKWNAIELANGERKKVKSSQWKNYVQNKKIRKDFKIYELLCYGSW